MAEALGAAAAGEMLDDVQRELQAVKLALQEGKSHVISGGALQRYFLFLNEKENTLLTLQLERGAGDGVNGAQAAPAAAPPTKFDKEDLAAVVAHLTAHETDAAEVAKALRALSSLAYADPGRVGGRDGLLPKLLRIHQLHSRDAVVRSRFMQVIGNIAHDHNAACHKLAKADVFAAILSVFALDSPVGQASEAAMKASEAAARIVASEFSIGLEAAKKIPVESCADGPMAQLMLAGAAGDDAMRQMIPKWFGQLVENEVADEASIARRFAAAGRSALDRCSADGDSKSAQELCVGWVELAKTFVLQKELLPQVEGPFVDEGCVQLAGHIMKELVADADWEVSALEAMSALVGNQLSGLRAFISGGGLPLIKAALRAHPDHSNLQVKCLRALAGASGWRDIPDLAGEDVWGAAGFDLASGAELTKAALERFPDNQEVRITCVAALRRYAAAAEEPQATEYCGLADEWHREEDDAVAPEA